MDLLRDAGAPAGAPATFAAPAASASAASAAFAPPAAVASRFARLVAGTAAGDGDGGDVLRATRLQRGEQLGSFSIISSAKLCRRPDRGLVERVGDGGAGAEPAAGAR